MLYMGFPTEHRLSVTAQQQVSEGGTIYENVRKFFQFKLTDTSFIKNNQIILNPLQRVSGEGEKGTVYEKNFRKFFGLIHCSLQTINIKIILNKRSDKYAVRMLIFRLHFISIPINTSAKFRNL